MHSQHVEDDFGNCINRILRHGVDRGEAIQSFEGIGQSPIARIFHRSRATNEYGIALVCPKIQVSNLDQRAGNAEAKLYRRN